MIRLVLGSALPVLGLAAGVAFLGPDLLTVPRGDPMILAAPGQEFLQPASLSDEACASTPILTPPDDSHGDFPGRGFRVFAFTLPADTEHMAVAVEDYPSLDVTPKTVVLVFDEAGRIVAAGDPLTIQMQAAMALADCIEAPTSEPVAPI